MPEPPPGPHTETEGDSLIFTWPDQAVRVTVTGIHSGRDGPRAEVEAEHLFVGPLHTAMLNLLSTSGKHTFVKALLARDGSNQWADLVEQFCRRAVAHYRAGEPLEILEPVARPEAGRYIIKPLIPLGLISLWYGDGKTCKSYLLEAACYSMALQQPLADLPTTEMVPAFLDWEWDKSEHADRLLRLGGDVTIFYRRCTAPLHDQAKAIKRQLDKENITFIGIDSLGLACGGDPSDPEIALQFFNAVRYLDRTAVIIHHIPKDGKEPFGSAYIKNSARNCWYFSRAAAEGEDKVGLALVHKWTNTGKQEAPIGLEFTFDNGRYRTYIERTEAKPILRRAGELNKKEAIITFLNENPHGLKLAEIAAGLDEEQDNISTHLSDLKRQGRVYHDAQRQEWYPISQREEGH